MEVCLKEKATAQGEVGEKAAEESKMVSKKKTMPGGVNGGSIPPIVLYTLKQL